LKKYREFIPQLIECLKTYSFDAFKKDIFAGVTVGLITIPLAMTFAIASGVAPERGIYTAIIAGFLISFLGGTRVQISGPTGVFVATIYGIVQRHGYQGLILATFLASFMQILMGIARLGNLIKYLPKPLIVGFTTGIACVIASSQIKDLLGLNISDVPIEFIDKWLIYFKHIKGFDLITTLFSLSLIGFILTIRRFFSMLPWALTSLTIATTLAYCFDLPIDTIASRFGEIPYGLPTPCLDLQWEKAREIFPDACAIALLGGIESLLSALIADGLTRQRHKPNCELIAQGVANLGSIVFGGIPATASIARTATNIRSGATTPIAGMTHAIVVFIAIYFFAPFIKHIPLAALASIMVLVAYNMSCLSIFRQMLKAPKDDVLILLTTFLTTVFLDLSLAIGLGMAAAALLFVRHMSNLENSIDLYENATDPNSMILEIKGPVFFGMVDKLTALALDLPREPKICFCKMRLVPLLDISGIYALKDMVDICQQKNLKLLIIDLQPQPLKLINEHGMGHLVVGSFKDHEYS
jgi:SulP family sulfate permease